MDTMTAFMMGTMNRGKERMVFDWNKAASTIKDRKVDEAYAGLSGDMEYTGGTIFYEGKPYTSDYTYLASTWATPVLVLYHYDDPDWHGYDPEETIPCYIMEHETEWNEKTQWPQSALDILYN